MNREKQLRALAARARAETPPRVDVTSEVLSILSAWKRPPTAESERPWMWLAALSSAVAVPLAVLAVVLYVRAADPLMQAVQSIAWVVQ
jgi:hypothetical protein